MERKFSKTISSLDDVFLFLEEFYSADGVDPGSAYAISLAVEEFFTNMVKYNPEGLRDITVRAARDGDAARVALVDEDVEPYDVSQAGKVDTALSLEERKVGGLGIFLSKELMDAIAYEYAGRTSTITLTKKLET
jgi:anti-sigma regulatory factor (Ser/Thr protein kinase)